MITRRMNNNSLEILSDGNVIMSVAEEMKGNEMLISISGEIRNETAHEFEDELMAAFSVCGNIRISFEKTTYIASLAMRTLLSVQQLVDEKDGASLVITGVNGIVREIFDDAGFFDILTVED